MNLRLLRLVVAVAGLLLITVSVAANTPQEEPSDLLYEQTKAWKTPYKPLDIVQSVDGKFIYILADNNSVLIYEPTGTLRGSVPVEEGVTAIETDARGEHLLLINSKNNTISTISVDFVVNVDIAGSPFKGRVDAPVTIVVFSDFE